MQFMSYDVLDGRELSHPDARPSMTPQLLDRSLLPGCYPGPASKPVVVFLVLM